MRPMIDDPVCNVCWLEADTLSANAWNPNVVLRAELRLLETSLLRSGWVQPILVSTALTIIDGYHRVRLALESRALRDRYGGKVPCSILDLDEAEAKMLTVRINRAKGTHVAVRMAELVRQLVEDHGCEIEEIAAGIGATREEVQLLLENDVFKARNLANAPYSRAWYPAESSRTRRA
ncbi:MAG: ParB N-terminal domain-containing protein [Pirellulales bacterium]|nr:ParB N-terminal domain-containing protein [Pirellulales bacterium]